MYGAGHEPATVEQFRQDFPEEMYDYSPRCFITSYKDCLKVNDYCQLLDKSKYPATTTKAGITFTNNGDGNIVVNGTCTADTSFYVGRNVALKNVHQYLLFGAPIRGTWTTIIWTVDKLGSNDNPTGNRYTHKGDNTTSNCYIFVAKDFVADNLVFKPQLFDLTEIYGAGNEPTSVEQFRADFPNELYDYKPYSIVPSYKKSLICKTKNLFDNIEPANNCRVSFATSRAIATQIAADTDTTGLFKIVSYNGSSYEILSWISDVLTLGRMTSTFTTPETTGYKHIVFGLNGAKIDTTCLCEINLKPSTTYTFSCNFTNITQGSISWTDMQLEEGSTATEYHPYGYL